MNGSVLCDATSHFPNNFLAAVKPSHIFISLSMQAELQLALDIIFIIDPEGDSVRCCNDWKGHHVSSYETRDGHINTRESRL